MFECVFEDMHGDTSHSAAICALNGGASFCVHTHTNLLHNTLRIYTHFVGHSSIYIMAHTMFACPAASHSHASHNWARRRGPDGVVTCYTGVEMIGFFSFAWFILFVSLSMMIMMTTQAAGDDNDTSSSVSCRWCLCKSVHSVACSLRRLLLLN